MDHLQQDYWVPGVTTRSEAAKYASKPLWREIMVTTGHTSLLWARRMIEDWSDHIIIISDFCVQDFDRRVDKDSSDKAKARVFQTWV